MIAKLTGRLDSFGADTLVVDVGGVGYLVTCSGRTRREIGAPGRHISLAIETHVREDRIQLFGFANGMEREWFRLLTTVPGVGARVALALLDILTPAQLARALAAQDRSALTRADGVGPKLAARVIAELRDRAPAPTVSAPSATHPETIDVRARISGPASDDAVSALVNLGYGRSEAHEAVAIAAGMLGPDASVQALIRSGLQRLAPSETGP